eukprot:m.251672 g.251672  ORF g.251672 m.251672 type:complete len:1032 (-) comp17185_c1_seq4:400-3495(-)
MGNLRVLDLSNNFLTSISSNIFRDLISLEQLWLQVNHIALVAPNAFVSLRNLNTLRLDNNQIRQIPAGSFDAMHALLSLDLGENPLEELPPHLFDSMTNLKILYLENTFLSSLPPAIFDQLTAVVRLLLFNGRLTSVPPTLLHNLHALDYLSFSGNRLSSLHSDTFLGLHNLTNLYLNRNQLTALPPDLFRDVTQLTHLGLGINKIAHYPEDLFLTNNKLIFLTLSHNRLPKLPALRNKPQLEALYLANNLITSADISHLPNLEILDLSNNHIKALPSITQVPRLQTLRINEHRFRSFDLAPLLDLRQLERLELAAAVDYRLSTLQFTVADAAAHDTPPPKLRYLDLSNVALPLEFLNFATSHHIRLQHLFLGWPGMNDESVPMPQLCSVLDSEVLEFQLTNTGYTFLALCPELRFQDVLLNNNDHLQRLEVLHTVKQLNVSNCPRLSNLGLLSADILDISGTRLPLRPPLCDDWGHRVLLAQHMLNPSAVSLQDLTALVSRCLARLDLLDLSDNPWLKHVSVIDSSPIVLSNDGFWSEDFAADLQNHPFIPVLVLNRGAISCTLEFGSAEVRGRATRQQISTQVTFSFRCGCSRRFVLRNGACEPDKLSDAEIAGIVLGGLVVSILGIVMVYRHYRRRRRGLEVENELKQLLLNEKEEEVIALKKAWEIDFSELSLLSRIDAGSEGAFGEVWKARWDTQTVAVKILKQSAASFDETTVHEFEKEVEFLQRTRHPHVVRFFGAGTTSPEGGSPFLVLEYVTMGSLRQLLDNDLALLLRTQKRSSTAFPSLPMGTKPASFSQRLSFVTSHRKEAQIGIQAADASVENSPTVWGLKLQLAQDIAYGMAFIHRLGQVHRDLKSGNVLVTSHLRAKITDFGCIRQVLNKPVAQPAVTTNTIHDITYTSSLGVLTLNLTMGVGTPMYMSPEVLAGHTYDGKADVFSFGVLLWEIATQRRPDLIAQELGDTYRGSLLGTVAHLLSLGKRLKFPVGDHIPQWYREATAKCVLERPEERPDFVELEKLLLAHKDASFPT